MRSPKKRSLQDVNEHFEGERNAEITLLDTFFVLGDEDELLRFCGEGFVFTQKNYIFVGKLLSQKDNYP